MHENKLRIMALLGILGTLQFLACHALPKEETAAAKQEAGITIEVSVDKLRPKRGETVAVTAAVKRREHSESNQLSAILFVPTRGPRELALSFSPEKQVYEGRVDLRNDAPSGLYVITVSVKNRTAEDVAKAWFLVGKVVCDAFGISDKLTEKSITNYIESFLGIGGNMLLVIEAYSDRKAAESALSLLDKYGLTAIISVETYIEPYSKRTEHLKRLTAGLWQLYRHHPCVVGIYVNHEGSGIYLAPFIKDFCDYAKSLGGNPLTICAPYIQDPNLISYLATIDSLDVIELQCQIMGSRRSDNRCVFPMTRCRDHGCLCVGGAFPKNKIAFSQIEQYANIGEMAVPPREGSDYSTATGEDIYRQTAGLGTAPLVDGFVMSSYSGSIYSKMKTYPDEMKKCRDALKRGIEDYKLISTKVAIRPDPIVIYYPYTDWNVHCWWTSYCPAFAAFRQLGVPFGIVPFVPPKGEELLPYYPMNLNGEQLEYLLSSNFVVVIPDLPGMEETDSILLKRFVEEGGTAILFGPHIPYGDRFNRTDLCGGTEKTAAKHSKIEMTLGVHRRVKEGCVFNFEPKEYPSWAVTTGKTVAVFEDGSAAVLSNQFGKGAVFTIPVNTQDAIAIMPDLVRDIFDWALAQKGLKRPFDVIGANKDIDIAMSCVNGEYRLAVVNHGNQNVEVRIFPLSLLPETVYKLTDLKTGETLPEKSGKELAQMWLPVKAVDCKVITLLPK